MLWKLSVNLGSMKGQQIWPVNRNASDRGWLSPLLWGRKMNWFGSQATSLFQMNYSTRTKYSFSCKNQLLLLEPPVIFFLPWVINPGRVALASFLLLWPQRQHPQSDHSFLRWSWGRMLPSSLGVREEQEQESKVATELRVQSLELDTV